MQQIWSFIGDIQLNLALMLAKSFLKVMLTYPVNVFLLVLIITTLAIKVFLAALEKGQKYPDPAKIKQSIDIKKSVNQIQSIKNEMKEVENDIQKMGVMFGYRAKKQSIVQKSGGQSQIKCLIKDMDRRSFQDLSQKVRRSTSTVLSQMSKISRGSKNNGN